MRFIEDKGKASGWVHVGVRPWASLSGKGGGDPTETCSGAAGSEGWSGEHTRRWGLIIWLGGPRAGGTVGWTVHMGRPVTTFSLF
jgi:hypothetical protein